MKNFKFYAMLMSMAVGMASFTACSDDDDEKGKETESSQEGGVVTTFDQVDFFQNNIVRVDSLGNMVERINGVKLNTADTTELYIGAESVEAASEIAKSWLSPDAVVNTVAPSLVNWKSELKDENSNVKTTLLFTAIENSEEDKLAEVTFDSNVMKHFSRIIFIKSAAWPQNATVSPYEVGETAEFDTEEGYKTGDVRSMGMAKWVCIRKATMGQGGMLLYISSEPYQNQLASSPDRIASPSTAKTASDILKGNWDFYVNLFKECDRELVSGDLYYVAKFTWWGVILKSYVINLSTGQIDWKETMWKSQKFREIQVKTFGLIVAD